MLQSDPGIIPRVMESIFNHKSQDSESTTVSVSFMELYMEELRDLLVHPSVEESKRPVVSIRENFNGEVEVAGELL